MVRDNEHSRIFVRLNRFLCNPTCFVLTCFPLISAGEGNLQIVQSLMLNSVNCILIVRRLSLNKKAKDPAHNLDIDTGLYGQYLKMQAAHAARITFLKEGHYEEPLITDADMCVPPLLHTFSGKVKEGDPQPAGNHSPISSCAFGPACILAYEKGSNSFKEDMQLAGPTSIPKLRALV